MGQKNSQRPGQNIKVSKLLRGPHRPLEIGTGRDQTLRETRTSRPTYGRLLRLQTGMTLPRGRRNPRPIRRTVDLQRPSATDGVRSSDALDTPSLVSQKRREIR